jgi:hypothetical protein
MNLKELADSLLSDPPPDDDVTFFQLVRERRRTSATAVEEQVKLLRTICGEMTGTNALTREVAILETVVQRERAADEMVSVTLIRAALQSLASDAKQSADIVAGRIDAFTKATDASTKQLTTWTKVMACASIILAVFALAQVAVAVIALLK